MLILDDCFSLKVYKNSWVRLMQRGKRMKKMLKSTPDNDPGNKFDNLSKKSAQNVCNFPGKLEVRILGRRDGAQRGTLDAVGRRGKALASLKRYVVLENYKIQVTEILVSCRGNSTERNLPGHEQHCERTAMVKLIQITSHVHSNDKLFLEHDDLVDLRTLFVVEQSSPP